MNANDGGASERHELGLTGIILASEGEAAEAVTAEGLQRLEFRDIIALISPLEAADTELQPSDIFAHHRALERTMKAQTVLPASPGIIFSSHSTVTSFLEERYLAISEAFDVVAGRWEFRLHVRAEEHLLDDLAPTIYQELRQRAHLSMPFRRSDPRVYSAAFLIERATTRLFRSRVDQLATENSELTLELTGPWPPYDFVTITA